MRASTNSGLARSVEGPLLDLLLSRRVGIGQMDVLRRERGWARILHVR